jgi:hypothetical protein
MLLREFPLPTSILFATLSAPFRYFWAGLGTFTGFVGCCFVWGLGL